MKFNSKTNFEISSEEIKDILFGLAKGFVKAQQWKAELDKTSSSPSSISESIRRKDRINRRHEQRMAEWDRRHKERMAEIDKQHKRRVEAFHKKMGTFNNNKTTDDIDISSLPEEVKRQIAFDYLKRRPLSEDKQERIADGYIREYGVIK